MGPLPSGARPDPCSAWLAHFWGGTATGATALQWEQQELDGIVADLFGYHAVQLGMPALDALRNNRMPGRWLALSEADEWTTVQPRAPSLAFDFTAMPFPNQSLDLVVMPHGLEHGLDPHQTLREVDRVLRPEGRVVISGFNPASLLGLTRRFSALQREAVRAGLGPEDLRRAGLAHRRLRDWLHLLGFEIELNRFGCFGPVVSTPAWRERWSWLERSGDRWWPALGGVYVIVAVKRVRGLRVIGLAKRRNARVAPAPAAVRQGGQQRDGAGLP